MATSDKKSEQMEQLEFDIDSRLIELRREALDTFSEKQLLVIMPFIRAAYGKGLCDVLVDREAAEQLCIRNGYSVPGRTYPYPRRV